MIGDGDALMPAHPGDWNFSLDDAIRDEAWHRFLSPDHFSSKFSLSPFRIVVDLPRSNFLLNSSSVALARRAAIGGSLADLHVKLLKHHSYSFDVSSEKISLWIYHLKSYSCNGFMLHFFLWRNGGPNWQWEFDSWERDEEKEWILVHHKRQHSLVSSKCRSDRSFVHVVKHQDIPISLVFSCLKLPIFGKGTAGDAPAEAPAKSAIISNPKGTRDLLTSQALNSNLFCGQCLCKGHSISSCNGPFRCHSYSETSHPAHLCASKACKTVLAHKPTSVLAPNARANRKKLVWRVKESRAKL